MDENGDAAELVLDWRLPGDYAATVPEPESEWPPHILVAQQVLHRVDGRVNRNDHDILSFGCSALVDLVVQHSTWQRQEFIRTEWGLPRQHFRPDLLTAGLVGLTGIVGNRMHDALEPADHPHHRALFHSWLAFAIVSRQTWSLHSRLCNQEAIGLGARLLNGAGWGSCSHLIGDATTTHSLPLIGLCPSRPHPRNRRFRYHV